MILKIDNGFKKENPLRSDVPGSAGGMDMCYLSSGISIVAHEPLLQFGFGHFTFIVPVLEIPILSSYTNRFPQS